METIVESRCGELAMDLIDEMVREGIRESREEAVKEYLLRRERQKTIFPVKGGT